MFKDAELAEWFDKVGISEPGRKIVDRIRSSPPSRMVEGRKHNVNGRFPSEKMGVIIQFESHTVELSGIYEYENDYKVDEFYDQSEPIPLKYESATGRNMTVMHTSDFFILRTDSAGYEEWKTEEELLTLSQKSPNRYVRTEDGRWRCPPGEEYAAQFGFYYRLRSSAEIDRVKIRNLRFFEDYLRQPSLTVTEDIKISILDKVSADPGIKLINLINDFNSDDINKMIVLGDIFVDLSAKALAEPEYVYVFPDRDIAQAYEIITKAESVNIPNNSINIEIGSQLSWDGNSWQIVNISEETISLASDKGQVIELAKNNLIVLVNRGSIKGLELSADDSENSEAVQRILRASPNDLKIANERYRFIEPLLNGYTCDDNKCIPERTLRNWKKLYTDAENCYGCGYVGLLPKTGDKGNRNRKLPQITIELIDQFIEKEYENHKQKDKHEVYGELCNYCEKEGAIPPQEKTWDKIIDSKDQVNQIEKRAGKRAAYSNKFYHYLDANTPRHGDRPFEIGHMDHTRLDIQLVDSITGENLGRPTFSLFIDAFSRKILAFYLSFDPPSKRSCMMLIRECVRRHNRLPQIIVTDNGKEFKSIYFETLLSRYKITQKFRPPAEPRNGSVIERMFRTTNTQLIYSLEGNTQIMKNVRQVTKSVNPKNLASWTLETLQVALTEYLYNVYDSIPHPALGQSPGDAFTLGLKRTGTRPFMIIPYNKEFEIYTMIPSKKGNPLVQPGRGIKTNNFYYWNDVFRDPTIEKTHVPVRYDPANMGIIYAFTKKGWVQCISEYYHILGGRSEKVIDIITREIEKRNSNHSKQSPITAKKIAQFITLAENQKELELQLMKDRALSNCYSDLFSSSQQIADTIYPFNDADDDFEDNIEDFELLQ